MRAQMRAHLIRVFDIAAAIFGLVVLSPVLAIIAIAVWLESPGPIIYAGTRVGRFGRVFRLYKFRTMVEGADKVGPLITTACDKRITRLGRTLRRTKLDEFPSLWNVLRGEMSIVGPRPENERSVTLYTPQQQFIFTFRPGITSPATVKYRHEEELLARGGNLEEVYHQIMQDKLAIDIDYFTNRTVWRDFVVLGRTFSSLFR